jgi:hypothetical protein
MVDILAAAGVAAVIIANEMDEMQVFKNAVTNNLS